MSYIAFSTSGTTKIFSHVVIFCAKSKINVQEIMNRCLLLQILFYLIPATSAFNINSVYQSVNQLVKDSKADASHILLRGDDAVERLHKLKDMIGDCPENFASAAMSISECPSGRNGGRMGTKLSRGEFTGLLAMAVETVDRKDDFIEHAIFNGDVGVVHGPIKSEFGYHLLLVNNRD
mmetsp:Transcript_23450/g.33622  ORF Transcript_23450/g.33622 Transcript_23450/m.33622 type:complete len:178 (+) Transcript_23450:13-546(+)